MRKLTVIISLIFVCFNVQSQGILFEIPDWQQVMSKAEKEKKLVFLYANVYDCIPCADLEKYAFQDSVVGSFFNKKFVNVSIDMESFPGVELAERYQLYVYPSMLFLNSQGEVVHRTCGAINDEQLLYDARLALDPQENLLSYRKRFYQGVTGYNFLLQYGQMLDNACIDPRSFVDYYFKNIEEAQWSDSTSWMMMQNFIINPHDTPFRYLLDHYSEYTKLYGAEVVDQKIYNVMLSQFVSIYEGQDVTLFATQSLDDLLLKIEFEGKQELQLMTKMLYAEQVEDWELYAAKAAKLVELGKVTDSFQLNEFAWKFYLFVEDQEYLLQARAWMKRIVKEKPTPTNLDTYASLLYKTGDKKAAIKKSEEAILLANRTNEELIHYQIQLEKFKLDQ